MRSLSLARWAVGLLVGLSLGLLPQSGWAQATAKKVNFDTVDQVTLVGDYYAGTQGKDSAVVMILHPIGSNRSNTGIKELAGELQAAGHSVLAFDFRGHGDSTSVGTGFWKAANANEKYIKGANPSKTSIDYKAFAPAYNAMLVNDIMAAMMFLERRNDAGDCNTKKLVIVGIGDGAFLGQLWLHSEWHRYRVSQFNPINKIPVKWDDSPEGKKVLAILSVNATPTLRGLGISPLPWMAVTGREKKVPMGFLYSDSDPAAASFADRAFKAAAGTQKSEFYAMKGFKGAKPGVGLLNSEPARGSIAGYVKLIVEKKGNNDWAANEVEKNGYVWVFDKNMTPVLAKPEGDKAMILLPTSRKTYGFSVP